MKQCRYGSFRVRIIDTVNFINYIDTEAKAITFKIDSFWKVKQNLSKKLFQIKCCLPKG